MNLFIFTLFYLAMSLISSYYITEGVIYLKVNSRLGFFVMFISFFALTFTNIFYFFFVFGGAR